MDDAEMKAARPPFFLLLLVLMPSQSCSPSFTTAARGSQLCRRSPRAYLRRESLHHAAALPRSCRMEVEGSAASSSSCILPSLLLSVLLLFPRPEGELSVTQTVQYRLLPPGRLTAQCKQEMDGSSERSRCSRKFASAIY